MRIIAYEDKYKDDVKSVCVHTGPSEAPTDIKTNVYILNMYCNYYIDNESENIRILVNDEGTAVGYILCAPDFKRYSAGMKTYFNKIRKTGIKNITECCCEFLGTFLFSKSYPAHIHIDIIHKYTGMGYGSQLLNEELSLLKTQGTKGVMLIVNKWNVGAVKFYKNNGFKVLLNSPSALIMGQKLN